MTFFTAWLLLYIIIVIFVAGFIYHNDVHEFTWALAASFWPVWVVFRLGEWVGSKCKN